MGEGRFFHEGLAERFSPLGVDGWLADDVVAGQEDVAAAFAAAARVPHVVIEGALSSLRAQQLTMALEQAEFVPHHHAPYPLHIAPRDRQRGVLADFMDWLARPRTARIHLGLVGLAPDRRLVQTQVQVSRMVQGERFPPHVDTDEPALACIYNFTRGFHEEDGGALYFLDGDEVDIVVQPLFNSVCYFKSTSAVHAVTPVMKAGACRYSATVFYVWEDPERRARPFRG